MQARSMKPSSLPHPATELRIAAHTILVPLTVLGLVIIVLSTLSAGALMANGVAIEATWLWPSLRWLLLNQPSVVAEWVALLALPALLTSLLITLLHRGVFGVAWWRWTLLGGAMHAVAFACATLWEWFARVPSDAWPYGAAAGFVLGLLATGWAEMTIRLVARLTGRLTGYGRNGEAQRTRPAFGRGTKVSVRPS